MADYYVDKTAVDDTGDGSAGCPWKLIATHVDADVSAGDTIWVQGGVGSACVYTENKIAPSVAGAGGNPIIIRPVTGELVTIRTSASDRMFEFDSGAHWWELRDFTLDAQDDPTQTVYLSDSDNILLSGLTLKDGYKFGIYISSSDRSIIEDCTIYNYYNSASADAQGILLRTATDLVIRDCTIYDIYGDGIHCYARSASGDADPTITIRDSTIYTTLDECSENAIDIKEGAVTIENCTFHGFRHCDSSCGGSGGPGAAIIGQDETIELTVDGCEIYDCAVGLFLNPEAGESFGATIKRNVIRDLVDDTATPKYQPSAVIRIGGVSTASFYHNTIANSGASALELFHFHNANSTIIAKNNIFVGSGDIDNDAGGTLTCDYNLWYNHYVTASGANAIVDVDPLFVSASTNDYTLQASSSAIDAGTAAAAEHYFGTAPDMGAFEYRDGAEAVKVILWRSDSTGCGDAGDFMVKIWMDEYAEIDTIADFSAM